MNTLDAWSVPASLIMVILCTSLLGLLTHVLIMRPLRKSVPLVRVIATLGVLAVLEGAAQIRYGGTGNVLVVHSFLPQQTLTVGGVSIPYNQLILLGIALAVVAGLHVFSRRSTVGLAMLAAAENEIGASSAGWSPNFLALLTWTAGAGLAGLAGVLIAPVIGLQVPTLTLIVIAAMAAALYAGFDSFPKALAASIAIGVAQSEISYYGTSPHWLGVGEAVPFVAILIIMVIRGNSLPLRGHIVEVLPKIGTGRVRYRFLIPIAAVVAVLLLWGLPLGLSVAISVQSIAGVVLLSVVVLTGYAGQLSLVQMGLAGIGAYVAGRLVAAAGVPFAVALIAGIAGSVLVGLVFALPALRTRGVNLAVVTLGLGVALQAVLFQNSAYTGNAAGTNVGAAHLFGLNIDPVAFPRRYAVFCLVMFTVVGIFVANVRRSGVGRRLISIRTNERAAASIGVSVFRTKLLAFGISSGIAGLGGILLAFQGHFIDYTVGFDPLASVNQVGDAVVGGIGYASGPIIGSGLESGSVGSYVLDQFGSLDQWLVVIGGVALILMLLGNANGAVANLIDAYRRARGRLTEKRRAPAPEAAAAPEVAASEAAAPAAGATAPKAPASAVHRAAPTVLSAQNVTVRYGGVTAVDSVSLEVRSGEVVGLIGPNGAGKTTMIDALTGFAESEVGALRLGEADLDKMPPHRRAAMGLARSFQSLELLEDLTVLDNLRAASDRSRGLGRYLEVFRPRERPLEASVQAMVERMELGDYLHSAPGELPYGRRRLVAIARAVATAPSILLLDEPAAGLDDTETNELAGVIRSLADDQNLGVLLVEHDMGLVMGVCDRIIVLNFGKQVAAGTPVQVRQMKAVRDAYLGAHDEPPGPAAEGVPPPAAASAMQDQ
jgi:sulfate-transporting ATPase